METVSDLLQKRQEKIEALRQSRLNLYPNDFVVSHTIAQIQDLIQSQPGTLSENRPVFKSAGRLMAIIHFGSVREVPGPLRPASGLCPQGPDRR